MDRKKLRTFLLIPFALRPVYKAWMKVAYIIGWINARILLFFLFYLIIAPIGIFARILGRDFLGLKIDKDKDSYWIKRPQAVFNAKQYEKLF